jgi:hypothetical protein
MNAITKKTIEKISIVVQTCVRRGQRQSAVHLAQAAHGA